MMMKHPLLLLPSRTLTTTTTMTMMTNAILHSQQSFRTFSSSTARGSHSVRAILDEKRSFRAGEDLKAYLHKQFEMSTVAKGASVAAVLDKMVKNESNVLVVLDAEKSIAGLVTDRDYIRLAQKRNSGAGFSSKKDSEILVDEIMTPKVCLLFCTPG